jgi:hypothetical protein
MPTQKGARVTFQSPVHVAVVEKWLEPRHHEPFLPLAVWQLQVHVALGGCNDVDEGGGAAGRQGCAPYVEERLQLLSAKRLFCRCVHELTHKLELLRRIHGHASVSQVILNGSKNLAARDDHALAEERAPQQLHICVLEGVLRVEYDGLRVAAVRPPVNAHGFCQAIH